MDDLTSTNEMKTITWPFLALMALCTVIGLDDIMYNFQNQGMPVITSWIIMCLLYVTPYSLMVGQLGSTFDKEGGGLSSWVRGTDGEFLGYFTAWTYWAASIPYAVDSANKIIVDLGCNWNQRLPGQDSNIFICYINFCSIYYFHHCRTPLF